MEKKIIGILSNLKNDKTLLTSLNAESDLINDVGLDSLEMINFILMVEDAFDIEINYETFDFTLLSSIDKISRYFEELCQGVY